MSIALFIMLSRDPSSRLALRHIADKDLPGWSYSAKPLRGQIEPPEEERTEVFGNFYAQNYFRIYLSDEAVEIVRETFLPSELVDGVKMVVEDLLYAPNANVRRWVILESGWDDDDRPFQTVLYEGRGLTTFVAQQFAAPDLKR